jgi:hypothetical protein
MHNFLGVEKDCDEGLSRNFHQFGFLTKKYEGKKSYYLASGIFREMEELKGLFITLRT